MKSLQIFGLALLALISLVGCQKNDANYETGKSSRLQIVNSLNGEDIFRAVYFYEGKAVELIPSIDMDFFNKIYETLGPEELEEYQQFKSEIITAIDEFSSDFFDYFEKEMTSGDHFRIVKAMDRSMFEYQKAILYVDKNAEHIKSIEPVDLRYENFLDENGNFNSVLLRQRIEEELGEEFFLNFPDVSSKEACLVLGVVVVVYVGAAIAVVVGVAAAIVVAGAAGTWLAFAHGTAGGTFSQTHQGDFDQLVSKDDRLQIDQFVNDISVGLAR